MDCSRLGGGRNVTLLLKMMDHCPELQLVWAGIPCGTASRAKDIEGKGLPKATRSEEEPWGITTRQLSPIERSKLESANSVYWSVLKVMWYCIKRGIDWIIENPGRSYLWFIKEFCDMLDVQGVGYIELHACMLGSNRQKWSRLRGTVKCLEPFEQQMVHR